MLNAKNTIEKFKKYLKNAIDSKMINGIYNESNTSISFYVYSSGKKPILSLRISDHRPDFQKYIRTNAPRPSTEDNTNISIEFYIPQKNKNGKIKQNRFKNTVNSPNYIEMVESFTVSSFNYDARKLTIGDDDIILKKIVSWLINNNNKQFIDPFKNTSKAANLMVKTAEIKFPDTQNLISNKGMVRLVNDDDYGTDYISESKTLHIDESNIKELAKLLFEDADFSDINKFNVREKDITFDDVRNGITLYHRPKDAMVNVGGRRMSIIDSIFTYGFNREFTSTNGGNMYGAGVYTVYNLKSSNEKARGYGSAILKLKLIGGYQDFLIFSKQLAQQTYGDRWHIKQQIYDLFPKDIANKILANVHLVMHDDRASFDNMIKSSIPAYEIIRLLGESDMNKSKCRGIIYNGGHDGACCFVRDFSSVVPVAVSYDNGRTWKNRLTQDLLNRMNDEVDTHFQLGANKEFQDVADKAINGYTMVWNKQGKVNYIPANSNNVISDVWFDNGEPWKKTNDGLLWTNVKYGEYTIKITFEDGQYMVYDEEWEPQDCTINDLPELLG